MEEGGIEETSESMFNLKSAGTFQGKHKYMECNLKTQKGVKLYTFFMVGLMVIPQFNSIHNNFWWLFVENYCYAKTSISCYKRSRLKKCKILKTFPLA